MLFVIAILAAIVGIAMSVSQGPFGIAIVVAGVIAAALDIRNLLIKQHSELMAALGREEVIPAPPPQPATQHPQAASSGGASTHG